jgi:hypothetical protein
LLRRSCSILREEERDRLGGVHRPDDLVGVKSSRDNIPGRDPTRQPSALERSDNRIGHDGVLQRIAYKHGGSAGTSTQELQRSGRGASGFSPAAAFGPIDRPALPDRHGRRCSAGWQPVRTSGRATASFRRRVRFSSGAVADRPSAWRPRLRVGEASFEPRRRRFNIDDGKWHPCGSAPTVRVGKTTVLA